MAVLLSLEIHGFQLPPLPLTEAKAGTSFHAALNFHRGSPFLRIPGCVSALT